MPPKMSEKVETLEAQLASLEAGFGDIQSAFRAAFLELKQSLLQEVNKMLDKKSDASHDDSSSSGEASPRQKDNLEEYRMSVKKVELPMFDGSDPVGWITRVETYFEVQSTFEEVKIKLARLSMEGQTIHWFNLLRTTKDDLTWEKLKRALIERYGGRKFNNPFEELFDLKQSGTVDEYIEEFELISSQVERLPKEQYMGYFMGRLCPEIQRRVRPFNPRSHCQMMKLASDIEAELGDVSEKTEAFPPRVRNWQQNNFSRGSRGHSTHKDAGTGKVLATSLEAPHRASTESMASATQQSEGDRCWATNRSKGVHHLMYHELMDRKVKGLCFRCGEKFHPLHQCPEKQFQLMVLGDDETLNEEGEVVAIEMDDEEEDDGTLECKAMGLFGFTKPTISEIKTMRLEGKLQGVSVLILVDSRASHNFISPQVTATLGMKVSSTRVLGIRLGDGHRVTTTRKCSGITIQLGNITVTVDAYVLDLGGFDMILGVAWLQTLGKVVMDWKDMTMNFQLAGRTVELRGQSPETALSRRSWQYPLESASFHSLLEGVRREKGGLLWSTKMEAVTESDQVLSPQQRAELQQLLTRFSDVFKEITGLPPSRDIAHSIVLQQGVGPVSVRQYRYPHHHKDEIERRVQDMLEQGTIKLSSNAFSSPVILVKKKDGSWHLCVNYKALNKVMVPDKYPIPMVGELLDELHGACYFSKLDLKLGYHQIRVREEDVHKTAFWTHKGHYEFLVMPFGLTNAPVTFQAKVLEVLQHTHFVANKKKCSFGSRQVEYLGHIISGQGVAVDPTKVKSVPEWPIPHNVKKVRGFLGLTGYYRKFISGYGKIAKPLTELTKKEGFHWRPEALKAFEELKRAVTTSVTPRNLLFLYNA